MNLRKAPIYAQLTRCAPIHIIELLLVVTLVLVPPVSNVKTALLEWMLTITHVTILTNVVKCSMTVTSQRFVLIFQEHTSAFVSLVSSSQQVESAFQWGIKFANPEIIVNFDDIISILIKVDPCAHGNHNCPSLADCTAISSGDPSEPNFQCSCQPGYEFEPLNSNDSVIVCADVDECAKHQHNCSGNEICHNLEPGFECYQADCAQLDCSHTCVNNTCVCPEGMKLDDTEINCQIKDSEVDIMCDGDSMKVAQFKRT